MIMGFCETALFMLPLLVSLVSRWTLVATMAWIDRRDTMESENRTDELTKWRRQDPEVLFTDAITDIVDVLKRLSVAVDQRDPVSVEGAVRLSVSMWSTAYSAHRQLIQRSEGDPADRSSSLLEARESLLELSTKATMEMATSRLYSLLDELQETFSIVDAEGTPGASRSRAGHHRRHAPVLAYHLADGTRASFPREDKDGQVPPGTTQREPLFTVVRVEPDFRPEIYNAMFTALQGEPHAKLLDLTPVDGGEFP